MATDNELLQLLRDSADSFLDEHPTTHHNQVFSAPSYHLDKGSWRAMADAGWLGLNLKEELGGSGLGGHEAATLTEAFGLKAFATPFIGAAVLPATLLNGCDASQAMTRELAAALGEGRSFLAVAWQESRGDHQSLDFACALRDGCLYGRKQFIQLADARSTLLVVARQDNQTVIAAVDGEGPGVSLESRAGANGLFAEARFDGAPLLSGKPLASGTAAEQALTRAVQLATLAQAAQLAGIAQGCLDKTLAYLGERVQFDHPISRFQAIRHRAVDLHIASVLARASWQNAADKLDDAENFTAALSAAKARCNDSANLVTREAVQMHGAMGFTEEGGVGDYLRQALSGAGWLGSSRHHRQHFNAIIGGRHA